MSTSGGYHEYIMIFFPIDIARISYELVYVVGGVARTVQRSRRSIRRES